MFRSSNLPQVCLRTVELVGKPSINTKFLPHVALIATFSSKPRQRLPKYPVPTLRHTISHFVKFARPLQRDHEYHNTLILANNFIDGGEGEKLQGMLEDRAAKMDNWLTPWWLDHAYLNNRDPLPVGTSPCMLFPRWNYAGRDGQVDAAAKLIQSTLKFCLDALNEEIPQETLGKTLLDMKQYRRLFGTTRIPGISRDSIKYGDTLEKRPSHIVVIRNGHIFRLSVFDSNGCVRSLEQIKAELSGKILPQSEQIVSHPVGVLTSEYRDKWAKAYAELEKNNAEQLRCIENSLFVVCLDNETEPLHGASELDLQALQCLHGGGSHSNSINRWFDKTLQLIVGVDGYCGVNYEQSPVDGQSVGTLMDFIADQFDLNKFEGADATGNFEATSELNFSVSSTIEDALHDATRRINQVAIDTEVKVFTFDRFGKNFAKQYGLSPDSMIQLAMQLAYYRIHRKQSPTYENATLRQFEDGRTGIIRLPNFQSCMFTFEMVDSDERPTIRELAHMLQVATQMHKNYTLQAQNGQAMDRHLLGLRLAAKQQGLPEPELFRSDAYQKMMHFTLLTSQLPTRHFLPMCFGPSALDCYAVCYNPHDDEIHFTVCTYKSCEKSFSSYRFAREIGDALIDMRILLLKAEEFTKSRL